MIIYSILNGISIKLISLVYKKPWTKIDLPSQRIKNFKKSTSIKTKNEIA